MAYTNILDEGIVIRDADGVVVAPCQSIDDINYIEYCDWVNAGNVTAVLNSRNLSQKVADVTPRQIRIALLGVGITESMIDAVINTLPSPTKEAAMITWKYSTSFQRNNALIPVIAAMLSFNDTQLDNLWINAATL